MTEHSTKFSVGQYNRYSQPTVTIPHLHATSLKCRQKNQHTHGRGQSACNLLSAERAGTLQLWAIGPIQGSQL